MKLLDALAITNKVPRKDASLWRLFLAVGLRSSSPGDVPGGGALARAFPTIGGSRSRRVSTVTSSGASGASSPHKLDSRRLCWSSSGPPRLGFRLLACSQRCS